MRRDAGQRHHSRPKKSSRWRASRSISTAPRPMRLRNSTKPGTYCVRAADFRSGASRPVAAAVRARREAAQADLGAAGSSPRFSRSSSQAPAVSRPSMRRGRCARVSPHRTIDAMSRRAPPPGHHHWPARRPARAVPPCSIDWAILSRRGVRRSLDGKRPSASRIPQSRLVPSQLLALSAGRGPWTSSITSRRAGFPKKGSFLRHLDALGRMPVLAGQVERLEQALIRTSRSSWSDRIAGFLVPAPLALGVGHRLRHGAQARQLPAPPSPHL